MDAESTSGPSGPPGPGGEDDGDDAVVKLAGAVGAVVLVVGLALIFMISPEPAPATASSEGGGYRNVWPSKKDLGIGDKPYTPKRKTSDAPRVKRTGTPFGDDSLSFLITTPSFGKLKTRLDWETMENELLSEGTPKATWKLAHLFASRRNPYHNYGVAISHLEDALVQGAGVAAYDLARAYDRGDWEVREDKYEAKRYYQIALEHGITNARSAIERLESEGY